jgi:hypothetical protein
MIQNFFEQLSVEEQEVFKLYKNNSDFDGAACFADHLNSLLRAGGSLRERWQSAAGLLSGIVTRWRCPEERTLYRATFENFVSPYVSVDLYKYPAFMSTTEEEHSVKRHWANSGVNGDPVMFSIQCPANSCMAPMDTPSTLPEYEFLLNRGGQFRILECKEISGSEMAQIMGIYSKNYNRLIKYDLQLLDLVDMSDDGA